MMPNPFTPPPEGSSENVMGAWRMLLQKWTRENSEKCAYDELMRRGTTLSVSVAASRALAFAENETNTAVQLFLEELRLADDDTRTEKAS